ncbi:MAG TPA: D-erythronate dehydrogenase [Pseudonocardiaceae bacterium]|nr:D-erythronate dehydrogenase [Pseudonocardiaceae bacterium]
MRVVVTGGAGFLGTLLARRLLAGPIAVGGQDAVPVDELVLADLVAPASDLADERRVRVVTGDLRQAELGDADLVCHLAGVVSGAAEADFDLGLRTNVDATRAVLEWCRALPTPPVLVFASSLAVYGADPAIGPVGDVDDDTLPRPQSSYGVQKFVAEQLVADYTRKGFVRGRSVRLMTVVVRPGRPNAAASGFLSGIIREPLAGLPAVCPVPPDTEIALSSPGRTIAGIRRAAEVSDGQWGSRTAMNLPALTTTPAAMAESLDRVTGERRSALIEWRDDPAVRAIVGSWPARFTTARATDLGLDPEPSFDAVVRAYVDSIR